MKSVLVVSQYWDPAQLAGGARSTARALEVLGAETGIWVVTGDRDVGASMPWSVIDGKPLDGSAWIERGGARVRYQAWDRGSAARVRRAIREIDPDVVYVPSLFAPGSRAVFGLLPRGGLRSRVVVAPEGELHPGALRHHSGRKRMMLWLLRALGLGRRARWRAADEGEAHQIRRWFGRRAEVIVAPDQLGRASDDAARGVGDELSPPAKRPGAARVVFVGSIVPKKGLHRALELLWPVRRSVRLDIFGPVVDPGEWRRCEEVLDRCEDDVAWFVHGPVPHDTVGRAFAEADLFVLPTLGENYAYTVVEALAAGCPVLTSDQTPWVGLTEDGCGWDLPLDAADSWRACVEEVLGWDEGRRDSARAAARARAARARRDADRGRDAWRDLFGDATGGSTLSG